MGNMLGNSDWSILIIHIAENLWIGNCFSVYNQVFKGKEKNWKIQLPFWRKKNRYMGQNKQWIKRLVYNAVTAMIGGHQPCPCPKAEAKVNF